MMIAALFLPLSSFSQVELLRPQHFSRVLPAGNYSGITPLGDGRFAVVDDKAPDDGFYLFRMDIDTLRGRITSVVNEGYHSSGSPNRDDEGICFFPQKGTLFISGEADNEVLEYGLDGMRTGRRLMMPSMIQKAQSNLGLEALTYDEQRRQFYTTTERPLPGDSLLRILVFNDQLRFSREHYYKMDAPLSDKHYWGVSALCALRDGRLLVLERQIRVPRLKIGASVLVRIYEVIPDEGPFLQKRLFTEFRTRLNLTSRRFANYEGMCQIAPHLLLLVADSQNQYKGVLRDWFRVIRF